MADAKAKQKRGLGRGLGAFFDDVEPSKESAKASKEKTAVSTSGDRGALKLKIRDIEPNPDQPRKTFDKEKLEALADSIKEHGVIQPVLVRKSENGMYTFLPHITKTDGFFVAKLKRVK